MAAQRRLRPPSRAGHLSVVVTGQAEWGGWRVPGAEYDLDPAKVKMQARLIASAPQLAAFAGGLVEWARKSGEDMPNDLVNWPIMRRTFWRMSRARVSQGSRRSVDLANAARAQARHGAGTAGELTAQFGRFAHANRRPARHSSGRLQAA